MRAASAHHLKVIPVLVDGRRDCEPGSADKDLSFFESGYRLAIAGYPLAFRDYATQVARHYRSNRTIAFWQIGNELQDYSPRRCDESRSAHALRGFADDMARSIKAVDPAHLVSLGTIGYNGCGLVGADYQYVHAGVVDLCEYHDYGAGAHAMPTGENSLYERIAQCQALHKPLFIGESGIPADVGDLGEPTGRITPTSLRLRAGFFDAKMTAAFKAGALGYLIWEKRQDASTSSTSYASGRYVVGPNDPANRVVAVISRTFGASPGTVRFDFEDGSAEGWTTTAPAGMPLSTSTTEAWDGKRSLAVPLQGATQSLVRPVTNTTIAAGTTMTYHVYLPSLAPPGMQAQAYIESRDGKERLGQPRPLLPGWNVLRWTLARSTALSLRSVGIRIDSAPAWRGIVFLDDIGW
jgi:hypothetical protein